MRCDEEEQALATMTRALDIYVDELTHVCRPLLRLQRTRGWFNWLATGLMSTATSGWTANSGEHSR